MFINDILMIYTLDLFRYTIYITFYKAYVAVLQKKKPNKTGDFRESAFNDRWIKKTSRYRHEGTIRRNNR